jgi:DNA-binding MarR family transcriptional regulator
MTKLRTANLLGALAGAVADRLQERLKRHPNQTDSAAAALHLIALFEGCSNTQLAQALKLSHSATVRLVDKLEAEKLVSSQPGPDRRSVSLSLTAAGKARARRTLEDRCEALGALIDVLSPEQQRQLDGIAETLLRALTTTPLEAAHICRLCDEASCPPARCPVHQRAHELTSGH